MFMALNREWQAIDASKKTREERKTTIPPGRHEIERIPNPLGLGGFWLVLKGTLIGAAENSWRQWIREKGDNEGDRNFDIVIEE